MALSDRSRHRGHPRYAGTLATLAVTASVCAPASVAQSPLPEDNAGTGQYVEPVPDAGGDRPSAPGGGGGDRGSLPPATQRALPGGSEGQQLESLATDPGSGAPAGGENDRAGGGDDKGARASGSSDDDETAISSLASAVTGEDGPGVPALFLGLGLLTLGAAAVAVRRRGNG